MRKQRRAPRKTANSMEESETPQVRKSRRLRSSQPPISPVGSQSELLREAMVSWEPASASALAALPHGGHSSSTTVAETGVHRLTVSNYALAKAVAGAGGYLESPAFAVRGLEWAVRFFPNGHGGGGGAFFLALLSDAEDVRAMFRFQLLDRSGGPAAGHGRVSPVVSHIFRSSGSCRGDPELDIANNAGIEGDDCFTVTCTVSVLKAPVQWLGDHFCPPPSSPANPTPVETASVIAAEAGAHDFVVRGYSLTKGVGVGMYIESDVFAAAGHEWYIRYYPDAYFCTFQGYVQFYLILHGQCPGGGVRAAVGMGLLDGGGRVAPAPSACSAAFFPRSGDSWGAPMFARREELEESGCVVDDCFTLRCSICVVRARAVDAAGKTEEE